MARDGEGVRVTVVCSRAADVQPMEWWVIQSETHLDPGALAYWGPFPAAAIPSDLAMQEGSVVVAVPAPRDSELAEERRVRRLLAEALSRAAYVSEHLHAMIPRDVWRDSGADDGQGHYEGDYRAEQVLTEIQGWEAALAESGALDGEAGE